MLRAHQISKCPSCRSDWDPTTLPEEPSDRIHAAYDDDELGSIFDPGTPAEVIAPDPQFTDATSMVSCLRQHHYHQSYVRPECDVYVAALIGVAESGKSTMLAALAELALSDNPKRQGPADLGFSIEIADEASREFAEDLRRGLASKVRQTIAVRSLGLKITIRGRKVILLFLDFPGEVFQNADRIYEEALPVACADFHLICLSAQTLKENFTGSSRNGGRGGGDASPGDHERVRQMVDSLSAYLTSAAAGAARDFRPTRHSPHFFLMTKSDLLAEDLRYGKHQFGDAGQMVLLDATGEKLIGREFDYQGARSQRGLSTAEWDHIFWSNVLGRYMLKSMSSALYQSVSQKFPGAPVLPVACQPAESTSLDPWGLWGIFVRIAFTLNLLSPDAAEYAPNAVKPRTPFMDRGITI